ncbi:MAG: molybdopterin molybdotransferase MoeA [Pseudomonadota bacterium]
MSSLISVDEALAYIESLRPSTRIEHVSLDAALGRRLVEPVKALRTQPPQSVSAMDGYAVRLADVKTPNQKLIVIGSAPAGHPFEGSLQAGQAVRVFTGSVIPDGADHVVIQEVVTRDGDAMICAEAQTVAKHVRAAGIDFSAGDTLIEAGCILSPQHLAVAAASNNSELAVTRRLKVGLIANGDELKPPGSVLEPGEIINSNPYGLKGLIARWGGEAIDLGIASDSVEAIHAAMDQRDDIDIFVPIGGASVGDHDHMRTAFRARGFQPVFEKIAVRPGKPTWFSKGDHALVLGLPGNPASAMVCAFLFLAPLLGGPLSGRTVKGRLTADLSENGGREHYVRAVASLTPDGALEFKPASSQDSSLLYPFLTCNALLRRRPHAQSAAAGTLIEAILIAEIQ